MVLENLITSLCKIAEFCYILAKPGKPGQPEVTKTGKHHCELRWNAPKSDGGSRIKGYNVEVRDYPDGTWVSETK